MIKNQPYKILWWTIPVMFLPIVFGINNTYDLQKHDTYFVINALEISLLFTLILAFLGGVYWMMRFHKLKSILNIIHAFGTSFCLIGLTLAGVLQVLYRSKDLLLISELNSIGGILILIFCCLQILFIINILLGLINGERD